MADKHSKLAVALAEAIAPWVADWAEGRDVMAKVIDERLAQIREAYKPEELARCPIVTHHPAGACAFCNTAAMREFILLPEEL